MDSTGFSVNGERCIRCGACARDCVCRIITQQDRDVPFIAPGAEANCLQCQHCLAVCPTGAISILGFDPDQSAPITNLPTFDQEALLVRARRSVRQFRPENVPFDDIRPLLDAASHAPTGCNVRHLTWSLVDDRAVLAALRERTVDALEAARAAKTLPETLSFLWEAIPAWRERQEDHIFRDAPHALIVSGKPDSPCGMEDVTIALATFELLANSAGLGTLWCGMLKMAMELAPELKRAVGLPDGHPYYCMLFGYPAVKYARTITREANIRRLTLA